MKDIKNLARKSLRYKRKDISVYIGQGRRPFKYVELLNISQNGMLIRGQINLNLNNCIMSKISFDKKAKITMRYSLSLIRLKIPKLNTYTLNNTSTPQAGQICVTGRSS
jgi:hypothetical protein